MLVDGSDRPESCPAYSNLSELAPLRITVISSKQSNPKAEELCVSGYDGRRGSACP